MRAAIEILEVERDDNDGIIVKFSDGTFAGYVVEELLELRPRRLQTTPEGLGRLQQATDQSV